MIIKVTINTKASLMIQFPGIENRLGISPVTRGFPVQLKVGIRLSIPSKRFSVPRKSLRHYFGYTVDGQEGPVESDTKTSLRHMSDTPTDT